MNNQYYYKILGITQDASDEEIDKAFKRMLKVYHPDNGVKNDEMMKDILEAYHVLSDPERRRAYDFSNADSGFTAQGAETFAGSGQTAKDPGSFTAGSGRTRQGNTSSGLSKTDNFNKGQLIGILSKAEQGSSRIEELEREISVKRPDIVPEGVTGRVILGFIALLFEAVFICAIIKDFRESLDVGITSGEYFEMLMEDPFLPTFIGLLVLFGIVGGGLLINAVISYRAKVDHNEKAREEHKTFLVEASQEINQLKKEYKESFEVLPQRFRYARAYKGIRELIEDGRVDSMKEALNIYKTERFQEDMTDGMMNVQDQLAAIQTTLANMKVNVNLTVW